MTFQDRINLLFSAPAGFALGCMAGYMAQLFAIGYGRMALILIVGFGLIFALDRLLAQIGLRAVAQAGARRGGKPPPEEPARSPLPRIVFAAAFVVGLMAVLLGAPVDRFLALLAG